MPVEPRGGSACSPRTIEVEQRVARQPQLAHAPPAAASLGRTTNSTTSAPSLRIAAGSIEGAGSAASLVVTPRRRANGSKVVPWSTVDTTTAKKTTSKNSTLPATRSMTAKVASTTGTAPRSPAHPSTRRSAPEKRVNGGGHERRRAGARRTATTSASAVPLSATSSS